MRYDENTWGEPLLLLQKESNPGLNTVTAYGAGYVEINGQSYRLPVRFGPEGQVDRWHIEDLGQLTVAALREIAGVTAAAADPLAFLDGDGPMAPVDVEVVLIGTGSRQVMLPQSLTAPLLRQGVGVEAMTTQAAARTYNILMSENRRVVAALIPPQDEE
jgi:uncharacterized protein